MNADMRTRALAARDAHLALLELKKLVDDAAQATHAAELEAVYLAISSRQGDDIRSTLRVVIDRLASPNFETTLSQIRERLETAAS
jgi:hypothetical protein